MSLSRAAKFFLDHSISYIHGVQSTRNQTDKSCKTDSSGVQSVLLVIKTAMNAEKSNGQNRNVGTGFSV
jgi:hypothetical protein